MPTKSDFYFSFCVVLLLSLTYQTTAFAEVTCVGDGSYEHPFKVVSKNSTGDGFSVVRGQSINYDPNTFWYTKKNIDEYWKLKLNLRKNSRGTIQISRTNSSQIQGSLHDLIQAQVQVMKVEPVVGAGDTWQYRITCKVEAERIIPPGVTAKGRVKLDGCSHDFSTPIVLNNPNPLPEIQRQYFEFEFEKDPNDSRGGFWTLDMRGFPKDDNPGVDPPAEINYTKSGNFVNSQETEIEAQIPLEVGGMYWMLFPFREADEVTKLVDFVTQFPSPYIDFQFNEFTDDYIWQYVPQA